VVLVVVVVALAAAVALSVVARNIRENAVPCVGVGTSGPNAHSADEAFDAYVVLRAAGQEALPPKTDWQRTETRPGTVTYLSSSGAQIEVYERLPGSWSVGSTASCR